MTPDYHHNQIIQKRRQQWYWKISSYAVIVMFGVFALALITKIRMFFVVLELFGIAAALFIIGIAVWDLLVIRNSVKRSLESKSDEPLVTDDQIEKALEPKQKETSAEVKTPDKKTSSPKRPKKSQSFKAPKL